MKLNELVFTVIRETRISGLVYIKIKGYGPKIPIVELMFDCNVFSCP